mgnify:FL=1
MSVFALLYAAVVITVLAATGVGFVAYRALQRASQVGAVRTERPASWPREDRRQSITDRRVTPRRAVGAG